MKTILLAAVVASLFSGLYFVYKDKGGSNRAVVALTIRIGLSLTIFVLLIAAYLQEAQFFRLAAYLVLTSPHAQVER